ncbi:MAG: hypothetical protein KA180_02730 [Gemmatimonadales bacterium]|jgi:threonine synthase|nr:hypothetical protein [Gemmatimonadota bacterium]MBP6668336.1 hypothetical protein [Gemmatimonadales bacterium]MBP9199473.1 hypothetical protein [Gemmatimonadales bacterium]
MSMPHRLPRLALLAVGAVLAACSDSNEPAAEDHTPVRFEVAVNGTLVTDDTLRLTTGGTDSVRVTFYNQSDENLDVAEDEHFSLLTFTPAAGLTATMDAAHHFRHGVAVTATAGDTGSVAIGYGHDALADEHTFALAFLIQ